MVLLLSFTVPRARNLALVFLNLPLALADGFLALLATDGIASLGTLVGFMTLIGTTLRNPIMMVAHWGLETTAEGRRWVLATAIEQDVADSLVRGRETDRRGRGLDAMRSTHVRQAFDARDDRGSCRSITERRPVEIGAGTGKDTQVEDAGRHNANARGVGQGLLRPTCPGR